MIVAIKRNGLAWRTVSSIDDLDADEEQFDGTFTYDSDGFTPLMVRDEVSGAVRAMTAAEIAAGGRAKVIARIDELRFEHESAGFLFNGKVFQSDQRSYNRIGACALGALTALLLGAEFEPVDWKAADNTTMTLDAAGAMGLFTALIGQGRAIHDYVQTLKAAVSAGETVDIESGWPGP